MKVGIMTVVTEPYNLLPVGCGLAVPALPITDFNACQKKYNLP
jgi:hypothetical protein